ncbi:MAG: hypothetical protein IPJ03_15930 [Ignavibacteriales bacterium]|nr:hypothetical protein [Ignavibacteriales bacterium]
MVIVQVIIDEQTGRKHLEVSNYLLKREDATDREFALAQALGSVYLKFIKDFAKAINAKVKTKEIKGK